MNQLRIQVSLIAGVVLGTAAIVVGTGSTHSRAAGAPAASANDAKVWKKILSEQDLNSIVAQHAPQLTDWTAKKANFVRRYYRRSQWVGQWLAMLGNIGTMNLDGDAARKAAALREAGLKLAEVSKRKDFEAAKEVAAVIVSYPATIDPADSAKPKPWKDVIDLETLMRAVSSIDSDLGRATKKPDAEFAEAAGDLSVSSLHLAALMVVAGQFEEHADWQQWCMTCCHQSLQLSSTIKSKTASPAKAAYDTLTQTCEACHAKYREQ